MSHLCLALNAADDMQEIKPYTGTKILPECQENVAHSGIEYFVPSKIQSQLVLKYDKCKSVCRSPIKNISHSYPKVDFGAHKMSVSAFINGIGGIIGLYIGYSALSILALIIMYN